MFKKSAIALAVVLSSSLLTACSSSSDSDSDNEKVNQAPTAIALSPADIDENRSGAMIGVFTTTDADESDSFTYSISDDRFVIDNGELQLAEGVSLDFEKTPSITLNVSVSDTGGNNYSQDVTITVNDRHVILSELPDTYSFGDSVSYSGQVARHLLIQELTNYISTGLQADLDNNVFADRQEVLDQLMSLYETTDDAYALELGPRALTVSTLVDAKQSTLLEISSSKKDLSGKIAGNDATGQHKDWTTEFVAFGAKGTRSPEQEIVRLLGLIADNAAEFMEGNSRQDAFGNAISKVYLAADGSDYMQLVQKILLGAVTFSQGADDYLDDDIDGKGLLADHTQLVDGKAYTNLEHQYDEGFGYFGAAQDYLAYTDDEIAKKGGRDDYQGMHDTDGDVMIDFKTEFNFGHSQNAAKRDRGTVGNTNPTDLTTEAMQAFIAGRQLLADTADAGVALDAAQMLELQGFRDTALGAWEKSIAATAIHYVNDTLGDYDTFGTAEFNYADLAKHWSELKGFVISLQFNPRSPLTDEQHEQVNTLIGDAPALTEEALDAYKTSLTEARGILGTAYDFDTENVEKW